MPQMITQPNRNMAEISALSGIDPALLAFRSWAAARDALLDDSGPEADEETARFRALAKAKATSPAGIAALAATAEEVFGGEELALDELLGGIIRSAIEQSNAQAREPEAAKLEASAIPRWIRVTEVQRYFGVSRATVYRAAQRGEITIYKQRGSRVRAQELEQWLAGGHR